MNTAFVPTSHIRQDVIGTDGGLFINCKSVSGRIIPALGAVKNKGFVPKNIICAKYSAGLDVYIMSANGFVYSSVNGTAYMQLVSAPSETPFIIEERTETNGLRGHVICDGRIVNHLGAKFSFNDFEGGLSCGVVRHGRVFGADLTDGYKLKWSGEGGVNDWVSGISGAGWAYPDGEGLGKILNVLDFEDRLILVRQHGLSAVKAFGSPENFSVEGHYSLPNIIAGTASVVGGKIYICTSGGLFCFAGGSVGRIDDGLFKGLAPVNAVSFGDKYFACGNHDALGRNVVYIYDTADKTSYIADAPVTVLCSSDKVLGYDSGVSYTLQEGVEYTFMSGSVDFGSDRPKVLEKIYIDSDGNTDVTVSNGEISRSFSGVCGTIRMNMRGSAFTFTVKGNVVIRGITAYAEADNAI